MFMVASPFRFRFTSSFAVSLWIAGVCTQNGPTSWTASPFNPPAFPLAVRSPYLNSWLFQGNNPLPLSNNWPSFWNAIEVITGWTASVVVDGQPYRLLGQANVPNFVWADQTAAEFTPTRSSFILTTGPMQINLSFISPIEPTDLVRQSTPFSYLAISASSTDGNAHNLRMYSDISGEFIAGDTSQLATWTPYIDQEYIMLSMQLETPKKYSEFSNIAQDGIEFLCFKTITNTTASWAITNDTDIRSAATNPNVTLGNYIQPPPRPIQDAQHNWTILGIEVDWGQIQFTPQPAVWTLGIVRSPSIQYAAPSGIEDRYPYFLSTYTNVTEAAKAFLDDFPRAEAAAAEFDASILADGKQYSSEYANLLALSARQLMGSIDITISKDGEGNWNESDVKVFMKNMDGIGSDQFGITMSVNTVDTLFAAFPAFMYLNPDLGGYLLSPLLEYQDSSQYTLGYAARNIGSSYPNATADGIQSPHNYGVEESANMLIMTLAYSQMSGNGTIFGRYYALLRKWADYLVDNSFHVETQRSADFTPDSSTVNNNQTNLSLKGIIGIACMARMAQIVGVEDDINHYIDTAASYVSQWNKSAVTLDQTHVSFTFGDSSTKGLIYNLYADKFLQLNLVPPSVYDAVTSFYAKSLDQLPYGLPSDSSRPDRTTTNWMMFAASIVNDIVTRDSMVKQVHSYSSSSHSNAPFSNTYDPSTGKRDPSKAGINSPAVGAIFSLLVLNSSSINGGTVPSGAASPTSMKSDIDVAAVAGGTIGGFIASLIIASAGLLYVRRRQRRREQFEEETMAEPVILPHTRADFQYTPQVSIAVPGLQKLRPLDDQRAGPSSSNSSSRGFLVDSGLQPSPSQQSSEDTGLQSFLELPFGDNREQLHEDVVNLRRDLDRLRLNISNSRDESLPSYLDPGRF